MSSALDVDHETVARATLNLLETRLRRLEFLLTGASALDLLRSPTEATVHPIKGDETIARRMQKLQSDLDALRRIRGPAGDVIRDVESLRTKAPEAFIDPLSSPSSSQPTLSDISVTSSIVLSNATLFPETASRLSSLQTLQIPTAEQSSKLIDLSPRIDAALRKQSELETEAEELRHRSAKCLEWWVKVGVVGMGEIWEDWESRVGEVEKGVKRIERMKVDRDGYV